MNKSAGILIALITAFAASKATADINSPHGLYHVSKVGVSLVNVIGVKNKNGDYRVEIITIKSAYARTRPSGDLNARGWFSPSTQQFYVQSWSVLPGLMKCNSWGKSAWGFSFAPTTIKIQGKALKAYKAIEDYGRNRKPKPYCTDVRINKNSCEQYSCNSWSSPKPKGYILSSRDTALRLFSRLQK